MALSSAEVSKVKHYLGYEQIQPDGWRGPRSTGIDYACQRLTDDGVTQAQALLTDLAGIDTSIAGARGRLKAEQVGDLKLNARKELNGLVYEQRRVAKQLAALLGVTFIGDGGAGGIVV